jgi:hypothetical protein
MKIVLILFSFIVYLIYIYINLSKNKIFEISNFMEKTNLTISQLQEENNILNHKISKISEKTISCEKDLSTSINKNQECNVNKKQIENNYQNEKKINSNISETLKKSETHLYESLGKYRGENKEFKIENEKLTNNNIRYKKELEMLYKYLKYTDYSLYEETIKNIDNI